MPIRRLLLPCLLAVLSAACLDSATLITVKADGSGTVEQTLLVNSSAAKAMLGGLEQPGGAAEEPAINEADLRRAAERMGGVRFVSATPVTRGAFKGVSAVYAFDDINAVEVNQEPHLSGSTSGTFSAAPTATSPVRFKWARSASGAVLTVTMADEALAAPGAAEPGAAEPPELPDPQMLGMMKSMFEGFRIGIDLQVDGTIVRTNADYVTGSRVTLLALDLGTLLANQDKLAALQSSLGPGASLAEARPLLKDVPGVKINEPVITIEYR
ncbi:MAG: hypothetical protein AB7O67_03065 [Vicinamibacterales bacterium]